MISERGLNGVDRDSETWFRRYNRQAPEKGGARKSRAAMPKAWLEDTRKAWEREANEALERAGYGERIDHRSLAERRDAAERSGDLELAAELSREPNVHLGPQALKELPGEPESFAHQKAERVKEDNAALVEERDGYLRAAPGADRVAQSGDSGVREGDCLHERSDRQSEEVHEQRTIKTGIYREKCGKKTNAGHRRRERHGRRAGMSGTGMWGRVGNGKHPPNAQRSAQPLC